MSATTPADVHKLFIERFTRGDLEGLGALYEAGAVLLPQPGQRVTGVPAIQQALGQFLAMGGRFAMQPPKVIAAADVAVLCAEWRLDAEAPDGSGVALSGQTCDVVRKQPDGRWLFAIDSPFGAAAGG